MLTPEQQRKLSTKANKFIDEMFAGLEHGDDEHRRWLKDKMNTYVSTLSQLMEEVSHDLVDLAIGMLDDEEEQELTDEERTATPSS